MILLISTYRARSAIKMALKSSDNIGVSSSEERQGILFVAAYCGLQQKVDVKEGPELQLVTADGQTYTSYTSVCRYLASVSSKSHQLLGSTILDRAKVQDWLSFRNSELSDLSEQQLLKVNERLQTKVYLAGPNVTLADLVLFSTLHRALVNIPRAQITERYPNLFRWFDFLQHTADVDDQYTKLNIRKPKFQRPPPPPVPVAKVDRSKAEDAKATKASKAPAASSSSSATAAPSSNGIVTDPAVASNSAAQSQSQPPAKAAAAADGAAAKEAATKDAASGKKAKGKEAPAAKKDAGDPTVDLLDIRVGQIVKVAQHPNADSLYVEEIDLGEDKPRQVVSGLVKFVPEAQMQNRRVVVVTNLKPAKMRDVMSYGMVLCASNDAHDQVEPIIPPEGVPLGEKITFAGYDGEPEAQLNPKKKVFEKLSPDLKTNSDGVACYKDVAFMTSKGPVHSALKAAAVK